MTGSAGVSWWGYWRVALATGKVLSLRTAGSRAFKFGSRISRGEARPDRLAVLLVAKRHVGIEGRGPSHQHRTTSRLLPHQALDERRGVFARSLQPIHHR